MSEISKQFLEIVLDPEGGSESLLRPRGSGTLSLKNLDFF